MVTTKNIVVKNKSELFAIQNHEPGEMAMCIDTGEIYLWDEDHGWTQISVDNKGFEMNLYDLNKNVISQLDPLTPGEITMKMSVFKDYYDKADNLYHMLLCKDFNYYTIFNYNSMPNTPDFSNMVCTVITELGEVYSIELLEDGAMEIWIRPAGEESPYAFYLFPYDAGVVYYG